MSYLGYRLLTFRLHNKLNMYLGLCHQCCNDNLKCCFHFQSILDDTLCKDIWYLSIAAFQKMCLNKNIIFIIC